MAVSSGLSRALLGLGQGYMNARSQGRRERQNVITTNARLKSDKQRNAIEIAKLTSLDEDRSDRRKADASAAKLKQDEFRQRTIGDVGLEIDRGMKRLEGREGDELNTGIHQLRGNIMNLYGATPDRPYGLTQDQLDRSLAAPGSVIPGVFKREIGAGNLVNPDYGSDPSTQFYAPQSIQELYGADTPQVGGSMAVRPEGSRNFVEFSNTPIDNQTKDLMGMMGQGASKYLGGQMRMPQDFGDMMSMKPENMFRSPEEVQKAVKSGIPESVMISREREATPKDVPVRATYGMKETDKARIEQQKASATASSARTQMAEAKLQPEIDLMIARTKKYNTDTKFIPIREFAKQSASALGAARLAFAQVKENNLNLRHDDMMTFRGDNMKRQVDDQRALTVRSVYGAMANIGQTITMAAQAKGALRANPNFDSTSADGIAALKDIDDMVESLKRQQSEINRWGVAETGSPMEWANIGLIGADMDNTGFLTNNPQMQAQGQAMRNNPAMYGQMGSRFGYEQDRQAGLFAAPTEDTMRRLAGYISNNIRPDTAGMGGSPGPGPGPGPGPQKRPSETREQMFERLFGKGK